MKLSELFSKPESNLDEIAEARRTIDRRRKEIRERLQAIERDFAGNPGPVRRQVLETGAPADVIALDREQEELKAEQLQLDHQHKKLLERHEQATKRARAAALKPALKALPRALAAFQETQRRLNQQRIELKEILSQVKLGREAVGLDDAPGITDPDMVLQIADAINLYPDPEHSTRFSGPRAELFDRLGCPRPKKYDPNADHRRTSWPDRDESGPRRKSIWDSDAA